MLLYHGSYVEVQSPKILTPARALDFGPGFYTTSSFNQAKDWAKRQIKMRTVNDNLTEFDQAIVTIYEFNDEEARNNLKILKFGKPDAEWLDFIAANRTLKNVEKYDLIIGPVADDKTIRVVTDYIRGRYTRNEAIRRLKPFELDDQITFSNIKALKYLTYKGVEQVGKD